MTEMAESATIEIPDFKKNWEKLKDQAPMFLPGDWEETLNSIAEGWQRGEKGFKDRMVGFTQALALPGVPKLERKDVLQAQENFSKTYKSFFGGVNTICNGEKLKWSEMRDLADGAARLVSLRGQEDAQAMALLTAISETHVEGRTEKEIRQKIAQHAFKEIFEVGQFRAWEWTGAKVGDDVNERTTQDFFDDEKGELVSALKSKLWGKKEENEMRKIYKAWRKIILEGDNSVDTDTADLLKALWDATQGKGIGRTSSLKVLQLAEGIYKELEDGGAFDVDLNYEEDDDEEDEDEEDEDEEDEDDS